MNLLRAILLAALLSGSTWANTIILTGLHSSLGLQQSLYFNENGVSSQAYWVGGIDVTVNGYSRLLFCVDLFNNIGFDSYNTALDFSDTPNLQRVGWLLENQLPGLNSPAGGAALQLAIWDIVHDNGDGFAAGAGSVTQSTDVNHPTDAGVLAAANNFEALSLGHSSTNGIVYHNVTFFNGTPVQTLMSAGYHDGGPQPQTPEPGPMILMASGVAVIVIGKRRGTRSPKP